MEEGGLGLWRREGWDCGGGAIGSWLKSSNYIRR